MDSRFAAVDHRLDLFEHQLLAQVDRRLRAQTWVTISSIIAALGVLVAAIKL
jgi:hypothetical protein